MSSLTTHADKPTAPFRGGTILWKRPAWSIPKDEYCDGGDRFRSLNRVRAEIVDGGVKVWSSEENTPYVQLKKYNTTLGGQPREYAPLSPAIAASMGVRKMIAHHLHYLPLSAVGTRYLVNVHLMAPPQNLWVGRRQFSTIRGEKDSTSHPNPVAT